MFKTHAFETQIYQLFWVSHRLEYNCNVSHFTDEKTCSGSEAVVDEAPKTVKGRNRQKSRWCGHGSGGGKIKSVLCSA